MQPRKYGNAITKPAFAVGPVRVRHFVFLAQAFCAVHSLASLCASALACWRTLQQDCVVCVTAYVQPSRRNVMPGIMRELLVSVTMSRLGIDFIREESARRQLDTAGFKEKLIQRLEADIRQQREASPPVGANASASSAAVPLTLDPATVLSLARHSAKDCLQHDPLPLPEQPPWQVLVAQTLSSRSAPVASDGVFARHHPDILSSLFAASLLPASTQL